MASVKSAERFAVGARVRCLVGGVHRGRAGMVRTVYAVGSYLGYDVEFSRLRNVRESAWPPRGEYQHHQVEAAI